MTHATVAGHPDAYAADCRLPRGHIARKVAARAGKGVGQMVYGRVKPALGAAVFGLGLLAGGVAGGQTPVPLRDEAHINASLVAAQAGDVVRNTCPTISARMFVVFEKMYALETYARDAGYTEAEVTDFLADKAEKARVKALAEDYLAAAGAVEGDIESYCQVGRDEIEKETLMGSLLRSSK